MGRQPGAGEQGYTLVELLVAIMLMTVVAGATTAVVISMLRTESRTVEMSDVLAEARAGLVRTQAELREAKRIIPDESAPAACDPRKLSFWLDENRDGVVQDEEEVTYELASQGNGIARLERSTTAAPDSPRTVARRVEEADIFTCSGTPPDTRVVDIELTIVGERGFHTTELNGSVRLRNVD